MHSVEESYSEPRVPDGSPFYSLQATMQAVTIVYLNRFLSEFLTYLSGLFHLCPAVSDDMKKLRKQAEKDSKAAKAADAQHADPADAPPPSALQTSASIAAFSKEVQGAPAEAVENAGITVLLDVEMNAPVIEMPRHSSSADSLEIDLGVLKLTNSIVLLDTGFQSVDVIDITLQQVMVLLCVYVTPVAALQPCSEPWCH